MPLFLKLIDGKLDALNFFLNWFSWFSILLQGICQLFGIFFYFIFETFVQQNPSSSGKGLTDSLNCKKFFLSFSIILLNVPYLPFSLTLHLYFLVLFLWSNVNSVIDLLPVWTETYLKIIYHLVILRSAKDSLIQNNTRLWPVDKTPVLFTHIVEHIIYARGCYTCQSSQYTCWSLPRNICWSQGIHSNI